MNPLLTKQVLTHLSKRPDELPDEFAEFLDAISQSYTGFQDSARIISADMEFLLDNIHGSFFSIDAATGKTLRISASCELIFGFSPNEFYDNYKLWHEIIPDEDKPGLLNGNAVFECRAPFTCQHRIIHKNGTTRWVKSKLVPVIDNSGTLLRVDGVSVDITDSKMAEAELYNSEKHHRQIIETAQEGILTLNAHNRISFVNPEICRILQCSEDDLTGREAHDVVHEEDRKYTHAALSRRRTGVRETLEIRLLAKGGQHVWVKLLASPLLNEDGNYAGSLAMITDITDRKHQEALRQASEANLQTIFGYTDSSYILMDTRLNIMSFNRVAVATVIDLLDVQLVEGSSIWDLWPSERIIFINGMVDGVMAGEAVVYDTSYILTDGSVRWYEEKWAGVKDADKRFAGIVFSSIDITERMKILQEHQKITLDLVARNKDLQQFSYLVSHHLRTPVANIIALASLLEDNKTVSNDLPEVTDCILVCVKKLDEIIKDMNVILQIRKPSCEKKEIVVFDNIIQTTKYTLQDQLEKVQATLLCDFDAAVYILSISSYLHSVFYTLILNSLKYRRNEILPVITIRSDKQGNNIVLFFEDNGSGIDLGRHGEQIFGIYQRFDFNVAGKDMGLFMVKSKIEELGGSITVQSGVNIGTIFTVTLPI